MKTLRARLILIALLLAGSGLALLPRTVERRSYDPVSGRMQTTSVRRVPIGLGLDLRGGSHFALEVDESKASVDDCADAIRRAERVVRSRMGEFGTTEPVIQIAGDCRLIVEVPGELDPVRARAIVQRTAFLELRLTDSKSRLAEALPALEAVLGAPGTLLPGALPGEYFVARGAVDRVERALASGEARRALPRGIELRWGTELQTVGSATYRALYALESRTIVSGEEVVAAAAARSPDTRQPEVQFTLTRSAGRRFEEVTGGAGGNQLAIVLDGRVQGRPATIRERIGASGRIELPGRSMVEASDLALVLRAGALPVPLKIVEERTVEASLGGDAIAAGVQTSILAVGLIVLVMCVYYRFSGVLAVGALVVYLLTALAALAAFGFALTLPGLAGFALSIGMAVDANVLIFERIREELAKGGKVRAAVDRGFRHAMSAIIDSNVTTALTASALFLIGTNAIQGFALTLLIGLCASMISAIFVTRTLFLLWLTRRPTLATVRYRRVRGLSEARYDFMRLRRRAYAVTGVLMVAGLVSFAARGVSYGIDFTGGALLQIETAQPVSSGTIRAALASGGVRGAEVQRFGSARDYIVRVPVGAAEMGDRTEAATTRVRAALNASPGGDAYRIVRAEAVSAEVGSELQHKAALAIATSFAGTLIYLAARFEARFGVAAIVATAHDIIATLAFIRITDIEISLVTIAALLTVLGYSLNDTIVIFDRVREKLRLAARVPLRDTLNAAINETLPRTVLTAGTTLIAAILLATLAGEVIRPFGMVLSFGVTVGTLSSIFVAAPVLLRIRSRSAGDGARVRSPGHRAATLH